MISIQRRFKSVLERVGDSFSVSGNDRKGVFAVLERERAKNFLSDAQIAAAALPLWMAYVPYDDSTAAAETVNWDGLSMTVQKVVRLRAKGELVAKVLVMV